jgi:uncharacterized membrane protein YfcA
MLGRASIDPTRAASIHGRPDDAAPPLRIARVTLADGAILLTSSTVAGAINSIAGGGSLITFPVLLWLGREPILANATNTCRCRRAPWPRCTASGASSTGSAPGSSAARCRRSAGGVFGAWLLLQTPSPVFSWLVRT